MRHLNPEALVQMLLVSRGALDAALMMLDAADEAVPDCPHPLDKRKDMSTMGHERWICQDCGFEFGGDG